MKIRPGMIATNEPDFFFDDRSLLEAAFGQDALKVTSINANCDCSSYYSIETDEAVDPHQITASAAATR